MIQSVALWEQTIIMQALKIDIEHIRYHFHLQWYLFLIIWLYKNEWVS